MFGGGFWGVPAGNEEHLTKEREPPARPIELEFPSYVPEYKPQKLTAELSSRVRERICSLRAFSDISTEDVESFNLNFSKDVAISDLLPAGHLQSRPLPYDQELQAMIDEIKTSNDEAFREVLRLPPLPGRRKPRLAYARNFFGSLEDMARYFDDSKDDYYRKAAISGISVQVPHPKVMPAMQPPDTPMQDELMPAATSQEVEGVEVYKGYRIASGESLSPGMRIAMMKNFLKTVMHKFQCRDHEPIPQPREKLVIRGVRIQSIQYQFCVARIPQDLRMARARQVEGPLIAVAARDELRFKSKTGLLTPEKTPFFGERFDLLKEVGCMLILAVQRVREKVDTADSQHNKWWVTQQRWGGGPLKWGQLSCEVYEDEDPSWSPEEQKLQETKRRQDSEETNNGIDSKKLDFKNLGVDDLMANHTNDEANKASVAIGGVAALGILPSGGIGLPQDLDLRPKKKKMRSMERPAGDDVAMKDGRRLMYVPPFRKKWYQEWQRLRPNTSMVDSKIIGKRIGRNSDDEFDEIYMLTGVNHHVALVRMCVHPDYLRWLETGQEVLPWSSVADGGNGGLDKQKHIRKDSLYVQRSTWFDMFDTEAREKLLVALWRLFCWLNREYLPTEVEVSTREEVEN